MSVSVDSTEVLAALKKLDTQMQGAALRQMLEAAAHVGEKHAKINIRAYDLIDTGNMLNSVQVTSHGKEALLFVGAEYGVYHEMGTIHLPSRPYLRRGVKEHMPEILRAAVTTGKRLLKL